MVSFLIILTVNFKERENQSVWSLFFFIYFGELSSIFTILLSLCVRGSGGRGMWVGTQKVFLSVKLSK